MSTLEPNEVDWGAFRVALGDIPSSDNPTLRKAKSRDFFWYSPILTRKLDGCVADLVVQPRTQEELVQVLKLAWTNRVPVTLRGRGSGNYGQAVPLEGGLVIEMTRLDRVLEIGEDFVRVEAGCNLHRLNEALRGRGQGAADLLLHCSASPPSAASSEEARAASARSSTACCGITATSSASARCRSRPNPFATSLAATMSTCSIMPGGSTA